MRVRTLGPRTLAAIAVAVAFLAGRADVLALPANLDADADGHVDAVETPLGSNPADAASTPEHVAVPESCFDDVDNDGDGTIDDLDSGCLGQEAVDDRFPATAGLDIFNSSMTLDDYQLALANLVPRGIAGPLCTIDFTAEGPVIVQRGAPSGGTVPVEILAMQLAGTGTVVTGGPGCPPPGDYAVTVVERAAEASTGSLVDQNPDPALDFPADSFFDVFFDIVVSVNGVDVVLAGGPPGGPAGDPVRVENVINTIPPYHNGKNTLCYAVPGLAHEHCPKAPPDHYACYRAKFKPRQPKREVTLRDQFDEAGPVQTRVLKPRYFCNPASKNGEPIGDPTGHLTCYFLKPKKLQANATVDNQFGTETITTKKAKMLCLPSEKNQEGPPQELDHFKCYQGKFRRKVQREITLSDQFGNQAGLTVTKRAFFCNPVSKNQERIINPTVHIDCYKLKPRPRVKQTATVKHQFAPEGLEVRTRSLDLVCAPSGKNTGASTTTTTTTIGEPTTTTTMPFHLDLSWTHPTPGDPPSILCGLIWGPPNVSAAVQITGPTPGQTTVPLDNQGMGGFSHQIFSFGPYEVSVNAGGTQLQGSANVDASDPGCPPSGTQ